MTPLLSELLAEGRIGELREHAETVRRARRARHGRRADVPDCTTRTRDGIR